MTNRTSLFLRVGAFLLIAAELLTFAALHRRATFAAAELSDDHLVQTPVPELSRGRHAMRVASAAIREGDGHTALSALNVVDFGNRPVEQYRQYYLANANELVGDRVEARAILGRLWASRPTLAVREEIGFHLAELYAETGDWSAASAVLVTLSRSAGSRDVRALAFRKAGNALVAKGSPFELIALARAVAVNEAETEAGWEAVRILESTGATLSRKERIERVERLAAEGDIDLATEEIENLRRVTSSYRIEMARAEVLARKGKRDEADRIVSALSGQSEILDRGLVARSWKWWMDAADAIEERGWRTIRVRRRSGTRSVKVGRRWVDRPVYQMTTRRVRRSLGRSDRARLAAVNKKLIERGERLLVLDPEPLLKREIHRRLARIYAEPRNQEKLEAHVTRLVKIDPGADELLQLMWDEGWAAWRKRNLDTARERFAFVFAVYRRPDIRRQARYWYARCLEEGGENGEASTLFAELAASPYEDLYAMLARKRGQPTEAPRPEFIPFSSRTDDWVATADRDMPDELRLAWELSVLGLNHDARAEIRANSVEENRSWRYSILARIHHAEGSPLLVAHTVRQAYPQVGSVALDSVPVHFLRMYYPTRHHDEVDLRASALGLDSALVKGLILQESGYDETARSGAGARGLMQLMVPTAREMAPRVDLSWDESLLTEPSFNIRIGTYYLSRLMVEFRQNPLLALAAYNAGIGNVRRWLRRDLKARAPDEIVDSIPFSETRGYVKRVLLYRSVYERMEGSS